MLDILIITALCCLVLVVPLSRALGKGPRGSVFARLRARLFGDGTDRDG